MDKTELQNFKASLEDNNGLIDTQLEIIKLLTEIRDLLAK